MDKAVALKIAKENREAHMKADHAKMFSNGPDFDEAAFGFKHGWYSVGDHSFNSEMLTGIQYDLTQGGWAFI